MIRNVIFIFMSLLFIFNTPAYAQPDKWAVTQTRFSSEKQPDIDFPDTTIAGVNTYINHWIKFRYEPVDDWKTPTDIVADNGYGDCEDYVIAKWYYLHKLGLVKNTKLVLVIDKAKMMYHLLLKVNDKYYLNNQTDSIVTTLAPRYHFIAEGE